MACGLVVMGWVFWSFTEIGASMGLYWLSKHKLTDHAARLLVPPQATPHVQKAVEAAAEQVGAGAIVLTAPVLENIIKNILIPALQQEITAVNLNRITMVDGIAEGQEVSKQLRIIGKKLDITNDLLTQNNSIGSTVAAGLQTTSEQLAEVAAAIKLLVQPAPPAPMTPQIVVISQVRKGDGSMGLKLGVALQPLSTTDPNDDDVVTRVVTVQNNTTATPVQTLTIKQPGVDLAGACYNPGTVSADDAGAPFIANAGESITAVDTCTDVAGNVSAPSSVTVTVGDTIAPPAPGAPGVTVLGQV